jgi:hypothetical protein
MTARESISPRGRKSWIEFLGVAAGLAVVSLVTGLPAVTRAVSPGVLIAVVLGAAGILIAVFIGMLRDLGELERRIVSEALALAFVITLGAMLAFPFLESVGFPALRPQTVTFVLVSLFAVGIELFSRRYQ